MPEKEPAPEGTGGEPTAVETESVREGKGARRRRSPLKVVALVLLVLVLLLAATGGVLYASDYGVEATVVDARCDPGGGEVDVRTKLLGMDHTVKGVDPSACRLAGEPGRFVVYHVRSGHTTLYESEGGRCLWDSLRGPC